MSTENTKPANFTRVNRLSDLKGQKINLHAMGRNVILNAEGVVTPLTEVWVQIGAHTVRDLPVTYYSTGDFGGYWNLNVDDYLVLASGQMLLEVVEKVPGQEHIAETTRKFLTV